MTMTHVYQPIMIRTLLESKDNRASRGSIARQFLGIDEAQINYYKTITARWPHITLKKHNVISYNRKGQEYTLLLDEDITVSQRQRLIELCNNRLHEFIDKDPDIRRIRERDRRSKSGSLNYDIFAKTKGVCAACGIHATEARLHVDHIVPINQMGMDHPDNMQPLCYKCNTQKRDRDETNFLLWKKRLQFRKPGCSMCMEKEYTFDNNLAYCIIKESNEPSVVIPKRHVNSFADLIPPERNLCLSLMDRAVQHMEKSGRKLNIMFDVSSDHYSIKIVPI